MLNEGHLTKYSYSINFYKHRQFAKDDWITWTLFSWNCTLQKHICEGMFPSLRVISHRCQIILGSLAKVNQRSVTLSSRSDTVYPLSLLGQLSDAAALIRIHSVIHLPDNPRSRLSLFCFSTDRISKQHPKEYSHMYRGVNNNLLWTLIESL